jgi:hypothetical protein
MKWLLIIIAIIVALFACLRWLCNQMDKDMEGY